MLRFGDGAVSTCAPSMDRRCACPTRLRRSPSSARCFPLTVIPPPWRGSRRSTTRSTVSSSMPSSLPISRTSASFWSSILPPSKRAACCCSTAAIRRSGCSPPSRPASSAGVPASRSTPGRWSVTSWRDDATLIPHAEAQAACRFTHHHDPGAPDPLPTGEVEILMTSLLDRDDHPAEEFATLYHLRWAQEENYKCFKCRVEVENWSGKSSLAIRQDFHAKVFTLNLTAVLTRTAQQQVDERHRS